MAAEDVGFSSNRGSSDLNKFQLQAFCSLGWAEHAVECIELPMAVDIAPIQSIVAQMAGNKFVRDLIVSVYCRPIHRNIRVTRINDLVRVITFDAAVMASGLLTCLVGCRVEAKPV